MTKSFKVLRNKMGWKRRFKNWKRTRELLKVLREYKTPEDDSMIDWPVGDLDKFLKGGN